MLPDSETLADKPPRPRWRIPLSLQLFVAILGVLVLATVWQAIRAYWKGVAIHEIHAVGGQTSSRRGAPDWIRERIPYKWRDCTCDPVTVAQMSNSSATDETCRYIGRYLIRALFI